MEWFLLIVVAAVLMTVVAARTLGIRLRRQSYWRAVAVSALVVPVCLAIWAAILLVGDDPTLAVDGFPPVPMLLAWAMLALPLTFVTSVVTLRLSRYPAR